ncbi:hypothetical protein GJAV_G00063120 [Gymnothorax javanicus]|nr:hypothetical protein GJAV_G00063120 [Gymnothorax javanicus]
MLVGYVFKHSNYEFKQHIIKFGLLDHHRGRDLKCAGQVGPWERFGIATGFSCDRQAAEGEGGTTWPVLLKVGCHP